MITPGAREEIQEEYDFIDACMETKVFETAKNFMVEKGNRWLLIFPNKNLTSGIEGSKKCPKRPDFCALPPISKKANKSGLFFDCFKKTKWTQPPEKFKVNIWQTT